MNKSRTGYVFQGEYGETIIFENEADVKNYFYANAFQDYNFEEWLDGLPSKKVLKLTEESAYALFRSQTYRDWFAGWIHEGAFYHE